MLLLNKFSVTKRISHPIRRAWSILPYLRADTIVAWHDFDELSWNATTRRKRLDMDVAEENPSDIVHHRQYWKAASRLFKPLVRVDTLAFFKIKSSVYKQMALMSRRRRRRRRE